MTDGARTTGDLGQSVWGPRRPRRGRWRHASAKAHVAAHGVRDGAVYAALDLGTNNCRLLVARPTAHGFHVIDAFSRIIRLGEGVSTSGELSEAAIARAISALSVCRDKMRKRQVTRSRLIATEACRAARNSGDFLRRVRDEVGLALEIVDRETEAQLAATGCTPLIDSEADGVILFDIGGGSSELVHLGRPIHRDGGPPAPQITAWSSMPAGVVTLAERHGGINVTQATFDAMVADILPEVRDFAAKLDPTLEQARIHLLGTSGTVTTIAGVHLNLKRYDRQQVDGCWMTDDEVTAVIRRLMGMSYEERVANGCIGAERADLVLAGCAILEAVRETFPGKRLRVADRGLREGILIQLMNEDGVWSAAAASP